MTQVFTEEIQRARNEKLSPVQRGAASQKGTRRRSIIRVAQEFFETICDGTKIRRKGEVQYCCICGAVSVWKGWKTGHEGSHPAGNKGDYA